MLRRRRRIKPTIRLNARLTAFAKEMREQVARLPSGPERDALLRKASQAAIASHLEDWANSPGLQPPT